MNWVLSIGFLLFVANVCWGETGCPEADEIAPCQCVDPGDPVPGLVCDNIVESEVLRKAFLNSARHTFDFVFIRHSILNYIPHEMFSDISINKLQIENVTLTDIFDAPPSTLSMLKTFKLTKSKVLRGVVWELLGPLTALERLEVYNVSVKIIKKDFSQYASDTLKYIAFHGTETKSIKPGVFDKFVNLERFFMDYSDIKEIRRDFFPKPFNSILTIAFNGHPSLSTIGEGMFTGMPNLEIVGLMFNNISVIEGNAFDNENAWQLMIMALNGNPLRCDCRLYWLLVNPPSELDGTCDSPARLKGKRIRELRDEDLNCN